MPVGVIDDPLYSNLVLINFALSCKFIVGISTLYSNLVLINFVGVVDDVSSVILYIPIWYLLIVDIPAEFAVYLVTLYSNLVLINSTCTPFAIVHITQLYIPIWYLLIHGPLKALSVLPILYIPIWYLLILSTV